MYVYTVLLHFSRTIELKISLEGEALKIEKKNSE